MRKLINILAALTLGIGNAAAQPAFSDLRSVDDNFIFESMFLEALQYKMSGDYNTAFDMLKTCRKLNPKSAAVLYEASMLLAETGNYEYAAQYAQAAVQADTTRNDNYISIALQCLVKANKLSETLPLYDTLIVRKPEDADRNRLMKVAILQTLNKYDEALAECDKVGTQDQNISIQTQVQRSLIYGQMGKTKKQGKILKQLVAKYPNNAQVNFQYSHFFYNKGDIDNAILYCQRACAQADGAPYLFVLADIYQSQKMDSLYAQTALKAFQSPDVDPDAKLARIYDASNRPDNQLISANWRPFYDGVMYSLLKLYPEDAQFTSVAHSYYSQTDRKEKAHRLLMNYISRNDGNEYMWSNIMYYFQTQEGENTDSLEYYAGRAVASQPENPFFHLIHGQALQIKMDYAASLSEYKAAFAAYDETRAKEDADNRSFALHGMAQCYTYMDSLTQAFAVYDQLLSENPNDAVALNNYAYHLALHGKDLSRAEKMSQKSLTPDPLNPTYLDTYAYILFREQKYTEALFVMERCVDQYKDDISGEVLDHYGDILNANGQPEKALEQWKRALEKDPDNKDIKAKIDGAQK